jgi:hypothetical protein
MEACIKDAAHEAKGLRELTWGECIPVDPVQIARRLGLQVVDATINSSIPVALVKEVGRDPVIMLNCGDNVNRKRFSCAYALGIYVSADPFGPYTYVCKRDIFSMRGQDFASTFALELLTDRKSRCRRKGSLDKLMRAIRFDIPVETLPA